MVECLEALLSMSGWVDPVLSQKYYSIPGYPIPVHDDWSQRHWLVRELTTILDIWDSKTCHHTCKLYRCKVKENDKLLLSLIEIMSSILCLFDWLQSAGHSRCSRYVLSSENDQRARHFSAEHANMGENESGNEQRVERHITVIIILIFFKMQ